MGLYLLLLYLSQVIHVTAKHDCRHSRPTDANFQSAVCCFPPWIVRDDTLPVEDIDKFINEIMTSNHRSSLFVDVTNFRHANLYNSKHPILLRWPLPVYQKRDTSHWSQEWIYEPSHYLQTYLNTSWSQKCGFSKTIRSNPYAVEGKSTSLPFVKYATEAKPWNVQVSVHLYVQFNKLASLDKYPKIWHNLKHLGRDFSYPSVFHLVVALKREFIPQRREIVELVMHESLTMAATNNEIVYLYLKSTSMELLTTNLAIQPSDRLNLNVGVLDGHYFEQYVPTVCEYTEKDTRVNHFDINVRKRFHKIVLEIWLSHLGNHTMHAFLSPAQMILKDSLSKALKFCDKFRASFRPEWTVIMPYAQFPITISRSETQFTIPSLDSDLRFLSCGPTVYSSLAFYELFRVFDGYTWASVIGSFSVFTLLVNHFRLRCNVVDFALKVVLEQGNPLSNRLLKHKFAAVVAVVIMFMGIVLTNAYKSTNVYNMVLPRRPIHFTRYKQLYEHHFDIYTRFYAYNQNIFEIMRHDFATMILPAVEVYRKEMINKSNTEFWQNVRAWIRENQTFAADLINDMGREYENPLKYYSSEVLIYSLFLENSADAQQIAKRAKPFNSTSKRFIDTLLWSDPGHEFEYFNSRQRKIELSLMHSCKKMAILVPYTEAIKLVTGEFRNLSSNLGLGIESYFTKKIVFELAGMWPQYVLLRHKLIQGQSGILMKWTNLINQTYVSQANILRASQTPSPAKLAGNILIVFSVYLIGIGIALTNGLGETILYRLKNSNPLSTLLCQITRGIICFISALKIIIWSIYTKLKLILT